MAIIVKLISGKNLNIDVEPSDTIENVKSKILDQEGIPVSSQKLSFQGQLLDDNRDLASYKIGGGSVLNLTY